MCSVRHGLIFLSLLNGGFVLSQWSVFLIYASTTGTLNSVKWRSIILQKCGLSPFWLSLLMVDLINWSSNEFSIFCNSTLCLFPHFPKSNHSGLLVDFA